MVGRVRKKVCPRRGGWEKQSHWVFDTFYLPCNFVGSWEQQKDSGVIAMWKGQSISRLSSRTSPLERFSDAWNLTLQKLGSSSSLQIVIGNSQSFTSTVIQLFDNTFHILQPTYSFLVNSFVKRALKIVSLPPALYQLNPGLIRVCQSILACNIGKQAPF